MDKRTAIDLLGGTPKEAARLVGVTVQAISSWADPLSRKTEDRVWAAKARVDAGLPPPLPERRKRKALAGAEVTQDAHA